MTRGIFDYLLGYSQTDMILRAETSLSRYMEGKVSKITARLLADEPLQYITSTARFCGNRLKVTPATLIPRPETEELADMVIKENRDRRDLRVLDIGTGSGCLAVTLARGLKFASVDATDISAAALEVAKDNAKRLKTKVNFFLADALKMPLPVAEKYDLIVSNPPYVTLKERETMEASVLEHEPALALFVPDEDPLRFYKAIGDYALSALTAGGMLYFEANPLYVKELEKMLRAKGFSLVETCMDMQRLQRFVKAKLSD